MKEADVLILIQSDESMMSILRTADKLNLPDWILGAGFVRNKVWDHLHGIDKTGVDTNDIDLVYFDQCGNDQAADKALSVTLKRETGIDWEIVNQAYAHEWNNVTPYSSTEDALSRWPETATCVGVRLEHNELVLVAPFGIHDLVNLLVRPSPKFAGGGEAVSERAAKKGWLAKWPQLKLDV
jgi:hypothetical protein